MAKDHFVPQHYLRHFGIDQKRISLALLSPYRFIGPVSIEGQCQDKNFYEGNQGLNDVIGQSEQEIAPVLAKVIRTEDFNVSELNALKLLSSVFFMRTRKSAESIKVLPRYLAMESLQSAIDRGELPPPPGGTLDENMIDFSGAPGFAMNQLLTCWMEMHTLDGKILKADEKSWFLTSDNPVAVLNQFCAAADRYGRFVGFSRSGFQLTLPISPKLCIFFYDPKIYKVGGRRDRVVMISGQDVEIVNSLQIQTADACLYCHDSSLEGNIRHLVATYVHLKKPIKDRLRVIPGRDDREEFLHLRNQGVDLPSRWSFCTYLRHIHAKPGDRRDPTWTAVSQKLEEDIRLNPRKGDVFKRLDMILNQDDETVAAELARFYRKS